MFGRSKPRIDDRGVAQAEPLDDLVAHRRRRRRREREHGRAPERLDRRAEPQVLGPEVVAPLGDAVRLVDDEQRRLRDRELVEHLRLGELLGREEHELERVLGQLGERLVPLGGPDAGVELRRTARRPRAQVLDLLALERDQRRDDDGGAGQQQRGDLVDRRLARAGRHDHERVAAVEHRLDRLALARAERVEAEHLARDAVDPVAVMPRWLPARPGARNAARLGCLRREHRLGRAQAALRRHRRRGDERARARRPRPRRDA